MIIFWCKKIIVFRILLIIVEKFSILQRPKNILDKNQNEGVFWGNANDSIFYEEEKYSLYK